MLAYQEGVRARPSIHTTINGWLGDNSEIDNREVLLQASKDRECVTPVVTITDVSEYTADVLLNGQPYISGTTITTVGDYLLEVSAIYLVGDSLVGNNAQVQGSIMATEPITPCACGYDLAQALADARSSIDAPQKK